MRGRFVAIWEWVQASDPGWSRFRLAGSAAVAMATALGVELGFARLVQASPKDQLVAMVLGAIVAMLGAMALIAVGGGVREKTLTAVFFPVAIGVGMILGVAVGARTDLMLGVFVLVMAVAVFVRRFGVAYFFYGFLFWLGYFFASFLHAKLAAMPFFMQAVALGSAWVLLLSLTVFRINSARTLRRTVRAFDARARGVLRACTALLQAPCEEDSRARRRLRKRVHGQESRLAESALMAEAWSAQPGALRSGRAAATLRRQLIRAQQALDALATTTQVLADVGGESCAAAARIAARLAARDDAGAERDARKLTRGGAPDKNAGRDDGEPRRALYRFARATLVFVSLARAARHLQADEGAPEVDEADAFEPAAGLVMGNLPGSASVAGGLSARGAGWNPLARLDLISRQTIQVAIAGGIAIVAGRALSPTRYYWAVIAAFIMFSGTATRSETFLKGFNRVLGTALGLAAAVWLAEITAGHSMAILATIVASVFCGFYLMRVGYAYMIFFITIMVAQLYTVFHEFTPGLLVLRLEETAIGAGIGFAVALLLVPLSTRDTVRSARRAALQALAELLDATADRLLPDAGGAARDHHAARDDADPAASLSALSRRLDDHIRRFALVTRPLTRPLVGGGNAVATRHRVEVYVAIARSMRAIVVALGGLGAGDGDPNLGAAARALAAAAAQLAEARPGQGGPDAADALADADAALSRVDPADFDDDVGSQLGQSLRQLHYLLRSLMRPR